MNNLPVTIDPIASNGEQKVSEKDLIFTFEGVDIHCPYESGTVMVPIRAICQMVNVSFATQNKAIKQHPVYGPLYVPRTSMASDKRMVSMLCLPMAVAAMWLASISDRGRNEGSLKSQHELMVVFIAKLADTYKAVNLLKEEMGRYNALLKQREELELTILNSNIEISDHRKMLKKINANLESLKVNTFNPQYELPFPEIVDHLN